MSPELTPRDSFSIIALDSGETKHEMSTMRNRGGAGRGILLALRDAADDAASGDAARVCADAHIPVMVALRRSFVHHLRDCRRGRLQRRSATHLGATRQPGTGRPAHRSGRRNDWAYK